MASVSQPRLWMRLLQFSVKDCDLKKKKKDTLINGKIMFLLEKALEFITECIRVLQFVKGYFIQISTRKLQLL